ncbi:MAG TPA: alpha/beta hydrolase [Candidatus Saccharimonadales bacterium]|nr:alpha/beta hydrolase [Candidatus Saccharimonadales bacterium]
MLVASNIEFARSRVMVEDYALDIRSSFIAGAPTLLLIHGIGVSGWYFMPFAYELARTYSVIVLDLPGYGKTPKPKEVLSVKELADIVAAYIRNAKLKNPILVGHSMGCQIAAQVASRYPTLVSKLILLGPTVNKWERSLLMQGVRLLQDTLREPLAVNYIVLHDYLHMGVPRYLKTSRYMIEDHLEDSLRDCHVPTLIIRGERDKIVPREWTEYLCELMEDCAIKEIKDSPHVIQYSEAKHLKRLCHSFIKQ